MRQIPIQLLADLKQDVTSLAFLWAIEMADGRMIRGTEHDRDITIPPTGSSPPDKFAGIYYASAAVTLGDIASSTDLSVDNLEVQGAAPTTVTTILDITVADIESGLLDRAPVSVLICNWKDPSHGYVVVKSGVLGAINHDSDGKYTTEVRGLTQLLAQTIIRTFSITCNVVKFGDTRCKFNVAAVTVTGSVATNANNNREQFEVTLDSMGSLSYRGGILTFTSGLNTGFEREVKIDPNINGGIVVFWDQFPEEVTSGDTFTLSPGCGRLDTDCKDRSNLVNFRGYGVFIPGINALTAGPTTTGQL